VTAKSDQDPDLHCLDPWIRIRIEVKIWVQIHNTGRVQQVLERYKFLSVVSYAGRSVAVPGSLNLGSWWRLFYESGPVSRPMLWIVKIYLWKQNEINWRSLQPTRESIQYFIYPAFLWTIVYFLDPEPDKQEPNPEPQSYPEVSVIIFGVTPYLVSEDPDRSKRL
jgi:hypothetical protein